MLVDDLRAGVGARLPDPEHRPGRVVADEHATLVHDVGGPEGDLPPASAIALAWASTSEPEKYVLQNVIGGDPGGFGPIPATRLPRRSAW